MSRNNAATQRFIAETQDDFRALVHGLTGRVIESNDEFTTQCVVDLLMGMLRARNAAQANGTLDPHTEKTFENVWGHLSNCYRD